MLIVYYVQVTWRKKNDTNKDRWDFHSVRDIFENGASFTITRGGSVKKSNYSKEQNFKVVDAKLVRLLIRSSGVLRYNKNSIY